jgi:hypothetical protein
MSSVCAEVHGDFVHHVGHVAMVRACNIMIFMFCSRC